MKVMQVNCVYGQGSTGRMVRDLHHFLEEQGIESRVVYGRGQMVKEPGVLKLCPEWYALWNNLISRLRGILYGGCLWSAWRLKGILAQEQPDLVHLHCINGFFVNHYLLLHWLKQENIRTILTLHAEFPFTGSCAHAQDCQQWKQGCVSCPRWRRETNSWFWDRTEVAFCRMQKAFSGLEQNLMVISVSDWLRSRAEQSLILGEMEHKTIYNGVNTNVFRYQKQEKDQGERVIFHATALFSDDRDHPKGGWFLLELARRMQHKPVRFLVAGKHRIQGDLPPNVTLLGEISRDQELAEYYSQADVTLITSVRETFSMVCAESLCCGTPVVGFCCGGPEEISLRAFSEFVDWADLDALEKAVERWLYFPGNKEEISQIAAERYNHQKMLEAYGKLYREWVR